MGNRIVYDNRVFTDADLKGGNCYIKNSLAGDELSIDTLTVTVKSEILPLVDKDTFLLMDSEGYLIYVRPPVDGIVKYAYGTPLYYYKDDTLIGKFFVYNVGRSGKLNYRIDAFSGVGLLENTKHYGGIYNGEKIGDIIADIIGGTVEYTIDPAYEDVSVHGWLPIGSRRSNLRQVLFQSGLSLKKDTAGVIQIVALNDANPKPINDNRLFTGGSIDFQTPTTAVSVSEHTYLALSSDSVTTLYSGAASAETVITPKGNTVQGILVEFDGPMHSLAVENGTILESGVNYAVLGQSSDVVLTGKAYTHIVREIVRGTPEEATKDNMVSVTDATLVSLLNSENVADRVFARYSSTQTVKSDIVVGVERPGDPVSLNDPFGNPMNAIIQSMDINISKILKASTEFVQGYVPTGIGNYYSHVDVIGAAQAYYAKRSGKIRIVLISGGQGGASGERGKDGERGSLNGNGESGEGGKAGVAGSGGRVFIATIEVTEGQGFYVRIGVGGTGGVYSESGSVAGSLGGDTYFGDYSTKDGKPSEAGVQDMINGTLYGISGIPGVDGVKGGPDTSLLYKGILYASGGTGSDMYRGGLTAYGAYGGGPAAGKRGSNGGNGNVTDQPFALGGVGGKGATPVTPLPQGRRGSGGHGGNGGGGGGGGGAVDGAANNSFGGAGGEGAEGSNGSDGASGIALVYW